MSADRLANAHTNALRPVRQVSRVARAPGAFRAEPGKHPARAVRIDFNETASSVLARV